MSSRRRSTTAIASKVPIATVDSVRLRRPFRLFRCDSLRSLLSVLPLSFFDSTLGGLRLQA